MPLNGTTHNIKYMHHGTSGEVGGIAVDWVAGNVYWTDPHYDWIVMAKDETRTNVVRTLIYVGLEHPHAIAVWPQKGYSLSVVL